MIRVLALRGFWPPTRTDAKDENREVKEQSGKMKVPFRQANNRLNLTVGPVTGLATAARPAPVPPTG